MKCFKEVCVKVAWCYTDKIGYEGNSQVEVLLVIQSKEPYSISCHLEVI